MGLRDTSAQVESDLAQKPTRDKRPSTGPWVHNNRVSTIKIVTNKDEVSLVSKRGTRAEAPSTIDNKIKD